MMPTAETLAREFCQELRASMTAAQLELAAQRNSEQPDPHICHSHDFCDANMALHAAFMRHGMDPADESGMELWGGLWDRAWNLAKASAFQLA